MSAWTGGAASDQGRRFYKMTGSGNDFVFVDGRTQPAAGWTTPEAIRRICARGTGVGADGIVVLRPPIDPSANIAIDYWNSDGSLASLCGNATLCATRLAVELGAATAGDKGFRIETGAGVLGARVVDGMPEFDLQPVTEVQADFASPVGAQESWIGYAVAGVPHLVVRSAGEGGIDEMPVLSRGRVLRNHPRLPQGANVNFVGRAGGKRWTMRTFERGVEGETLACGTGAVATAILLAARGEGGLETEIWTRSGQMLAVRLATDGTNWLPTLRGEGRIVFDGTLVEL